MKLKDDNQVIENGAKALLGFLAKKKREQLQKQDPEERMTEDEENVFTSNRKDMFTDSELENAQNNSTEIFENLKCSYSDDFESHSHIKYAVYIGVAVQKIGSNLNELDSVRSGNTEIQTAKIQGLMNPEVIAVYPDIPVCQAWTIEQKFIKHLITTSPLQTINKSSAFGLGRLPRPFSTDLKYTITLLRGINRNTRYNAYIPVTNAVESAEGDFDMAIENLKEIEEIGDAAAKQMCNFADYLISTWNPHEAWDPNNPTERLPKFKPCPCSILPSVWISEREYYYQKNGKNAERFDEWKKDHTDEYEDFQKEKKQHVDDLINRQHAEMVNTTQAHDCTGTYCLRTRKATNIQECKFDFPKTQCSHTSLKFKRHGTNLSGDIYYKVRKRLSLQFFSYVFLVKHF